MKNVLAVLLLVSALAVAAAEPELCKTQSGPYYFLSSWKEGNSTVTSMAVVEDDKLSTEQGDVVYTGDLNGDGRDDFIFNSYSSHGSAGDTTHSVYVQCRGYLKSAGGEYFARAEVPPEDPQFKSEYREIVFYSYKRGASAQILYKNNEALVTPHIWNFNPETQQYEGESE
ncbi:FG-GAP repeat protein [Pseudomonas purpurea]|uniref:FG-GAP repeat protein n=1 Tax=Pseudomonas purpurea TaxID=3136737 RepID=UPI003264C850